MHASEDFLSNHVAEKISNGSSDTCSFYNLAVQAGRDGASKFRSLLKREGFKISACKAEQILLSQCPRGMFAVACRAFEQNVDCCFKARIVRPSNGVELVKLEKIEDFASLEITLAFDVFPPTERQRSLQDADCDADRGRCSKYAA